MKRILLFAVFISGALRTQAANSFLISAPVQSQVDAQGQGVDACQHAGVTLVRHNITGQAAIQVGSNVPNDPSRIFTRPGQGSFFMTDAGGQWVNAALTNQTVLAVVETLNGQHGWLGPDYAGAGTSLITKPNFVGGSLPMPGILMTRLPSPHLVQGSPTAMVLEVPPTADPSGLGTGLRVWKQTAGLPQAPWDLVADLPWSTSTPQWVTDTAVSDGQAYVYGVSFIYGWPGGLGAGAADLADHYITNAKGLSGAYFASLIQPTPTAFPTLVPPAATPNIGDEPWVAYPNPLIGSELHLAFKTEKAMAQYWVSFYAIDGSKVLGVQGQAPEAGWQKPILDLGKLAPGVYLVRMRLLEPNQDEKVLPVRKLAIIK